MSRSLEALMERSMEPHRTKVSEIHREARVKGLCAALITACLLILVSYTIVISLTLQLNDLREKYSAMEAERIEVSKLTVEYERKISTVQRELGNAQLKLNEAYDQAEENEIIIAELEVQIKESEELLIFYNDNVVFLNDTDTLYHRKTCGRLSQWDTEPYIISQIRPYGYSPCSECFHP